MWQGVGQIDIQVARASWVVDHKPIIFSLLVRDIKACNIDVVARIVDRILGRRKNVPKHRWFMILDPPPLDCCRDPRRLFLMHLSHMLLKACRIRKTHIVVSTPSLVTYQTLLMSLSLVVIELGLRSKCLGTAFDGANKCSTPKLSFECNQLSFCKADPGTRSEEKLNESLMIRIREREKSVV